MTRLSRVLVLGLVLALGLLAPALAQPPAANAPATAAAASSPAPGTPPAAPASASAASDTTTPAAVPADHGSSPATAEASPGGAAEASAHEGIGHSLGIWTTLPFAGLLLCIALLPLVAGHWWEHNSNKAIIAAIFGIPIGLYIGIKDWHLIMHTTIEYISFIVLLGSLFTISGGIYLTGNLTGRPLTNLGFLAIGAALANIVGTTGASMLLIRPMLRANAERKHKQHLFIFFIFVVSNCGGLLTPLGDPPLFLGYLRGVPFFWTLKLFPEWLTVNALVLATFMVLETRAYAKESKQDKLDDLEVRIPIGISGRVNILFLGGVLAAIFISKPLFVREAIMLAMAALSYFWAPKAPREENKFTFTAINEVAILFAGIFLAMVPALQILEARGAELGISEAWKFFWATGALSSFLDNAPTYLTFASTACGLLGGSADNLASLLQAGPVLASGMHQGEYFLEAISCGAVMMGANSYIGNGPNFMVKAIVEEAGVKMPSFFGYMVYSGVVLLPSFALVTFIFFRA